VNVVVIGAQWGDEGKGKIVDFLSSEADTIVRFSGGANAGHTIVHDGKTYKLHLVPSGIIYPETRVILGSGMVIDPEALFEELSELENVGISWEGRVLISDRAHLVLPSHRAEDVERDKRRKNPIGTTGRGIGRESTTLQSYGLRHHASALTTRIYLSCPPTRLNHLFHQMAGLSFSVPPYHSIMKSVREY
jgi:adenylosuccinate synthase